MAKVAAPIISTVTRKAPLRPVRSPIRPKISAPTGRKAKPTAKLISAKTSPAASESPAEKVLAMIVASGTKTKKSYHSNAVPAAEAAITTRMSAAGPASAVIVVRASLMPTGLPLSAERVKGDAKNIRPSAESAPRGPAGRCSSYLGRLFSGASRRGPCRSRRRLRR